MAGVLPQFRKFQELLLQYYEENGRELAWRLPEPDGTFDPYKIWLSEIMLQQTQVNRVIPKYQQFLAKFPDVSSLAQASVADVLQLWSGLGYNRRAKFLWQSAGTIVNAYDGQFPQSLTKLTQLPGVGLNTAGAIMTYAFNQPVTFIETNIRAVYIYHFFANQHKVSDKDIKPLLANTMDEDNPRQFYWALMDYGTWLKANVGNSSQRSRYYVKHSAFIGSKRQVRGAIIRFLVGRRYASHHQLSNNISDSRLTAVLQELQHEHLIIKRGRYFSLHDS